MMGRILTTFAAAGLTAGLATATLAADKEMDWGKFQNGEIRSGYTYAEKETRAMEDDDFQNPAFLWVERGEELWSKVDGAAGKSCATCHNDASQTMAMVGATYPVYDEKTKKMKALQHQVNSCRTEQMKAEPWKWESDQMLSIATYINHQAKDKPMSVKIDGPAAPFFEKGKEFYETRRGQLDMACTHCHVDNAGKMIRANRLSQGQGNGFPTYRLKWSKVGSLHRRFKGGNDNIPAAAFKRGLPVETPAVRN